MTHSAPAARRLVVAALLTCGAGLLTACGSSGGSSAQPGSTVTVTTTPPGTTASPATASPSSTVPGSAGGGSGAAGCTTSALKVTIGQGNGAAGSTIIPLQFTNQSSSTCTMFGFPGVSFVSGAGGSQIGAPADRDAGAARSLVTLAPGAIASAQLQVAVAQNFPAAQCGLTTAHWLKIFPPGETAALFVKYSASTCSHPKEKVLHVQAVQSGSGVS
jgi:Protein of unknown function (DUF4232)